jgi:hypothetical protein
LAEAGTSEEAPGDDAEPGAVPAPGGAGSEAAGGEEPEREPAAAQADEGEVEVGAEPAAGPEPTSGPEPAAEEPSGPTGEPESPFSIEGMIEALRQAKVAELLLSTVSTLASVAYGKLEVGDLPEAKTAIDAIGALVPLLEGKVDDAIRRDLEQALANLRLAYADAVAKAE